MEAFRFEFSTEFAAPAEAVWQFHMRPEALDILTPRWVGLRITDPGDGVADGSLVRAEVGLWPFRFEWQALHSGVRANRSFTDMAMKSPFRYWLHQHVIESMSPTSCRLRDVIFVLPPSWAPKRVAQPILRIALMALFKWRHRQTGRALRLNLGELHLVGSNCPVPNP